MTAETREPPETARSARPVVVFLMSACATMTIALVAAINLAVPKLSASTLRPSSSELLWIVDAYVLVFACLLIPAGAFGDRHGRKGALLGGLGVFTLGCGPASSASGWRSSGCSRCSSSTPGTCSSRGGTHRR